MHTVAVLGAGSWGTAVAIHLAKNGCHVALWGHDADNIAAMKKTGSNERYLPNVAFPSTLKPTADLSESLKSSIWIIAVPSHAFKEVLEQLPKPKIGLAWLTKGLDPSSNRLLSDLVMERWGKSFPFAVISGPSFAREVAQALPTALTISGNSTDYSCTIRNLFHQQNMRAYLSEDYTGVQLCGAVKNVMAIACGISDGLKYGANAKAALITRGLAEMTRLGLKLNAKPETFMGLAGVGDLVLTCTDDQSRNRRFGLHLGQGFSNAQAEKSIGQVIEGKHNAAQVCALAKKFQVDMPICCEVYTLLAGETTPVNAAENLMSRPPRSE